MSNDRELRHAAEQALEAMRDAGFEHAQVTASHTQLHELNVTDNEPTLLRSTDSGKLMLLGIVDQRMASTETADLSPAAVRERALALFADARSAPQDAAYAVSAQQRAELVQGPQEADSEAMADAVAQLLSFRASATPKMMLGESFASHRLQRQRVLTTGGTDLGSAVGCYELMAFGTGRDGTRSSSFNYASGATHDLRACAAPELFGIGQMMRDTERQTDPRPFPAKFEGDVVLMPNAVHDLLGWLLGQLGDMQLIAGSSLYAAAAGKTIAAPQLTVRSRFDGPGTAAVSADAFATPPLTLLDAGVLRTLLPTLYGSRKTGHPHVPVPAGPCWEIASGDTPLPDLVGGVRRGALVGRLSMGMPAANGSFSGVIKNSFAIEGGEVGHALSEAMVSGNMAQMLLAVTGASREALDGSGWRLPWLRVAGLHFS